jgi:hypothetical protein
VAWVATSSCVPTSALDGPAGPILSDQPVARAADGIIGLRSLSPPPSGLVLIDAEEEEGGKQINRCPASLER